LPEHLNDLRIVVDDQHACWRVGAVGHDMSHQSSAIARMAMRLIKTHSQS
jgi:hypothetical protein